MKSNEKYIDILKRMWSQPFIASIIVFTVLFSFLVILFSFVDGDPIVDDHYFHFKYAYLLRTEGWDAVQNFDWIYLTSLAEGGSRYTVNLFQYSLIPFTYINNWLFALHVADAFYCSVAIAIFYFIMRKEGVRNPLFFTFLLVGMASIFSRLLLGRAFVLMIGLVFLEMYFAVHKKYIPLFIAIFVHVLWHQITYFLPVFFVLLVEASRYFVEKKLAWKNFLWTSGAVVLGMAFFPGFPYSLFNWFSGLFSMIGNSGGGGGGGAAVQRSLAGNELSLIDFSTYTAGQGFATVVLIFCLMAVFGIIYLYKKHNHAVCDVVKKEQIQWIVILSIFVLCTIIGSFMVTGRLFDFVFPTFVLLLAFVVTILLDTDILPSKSFSGKWFQVFAWSIVLLLCFNSFSFVYKEAHMFDFRPSKLVAEWIDERSDDGSHVFIQNWSVFNLLFFANANNTYSTGIEPMALKSYDESLYWKYYNIFFNSYYCEKYEDCEQDIYDELTIKRADDQDAKNAFEKENSEKIINSIKNDFNAEFIVVDSPKTSRVIRLSPELIEDYYEVQSEKYDGFGMYYTVFELK